MFSYISSLFWSETNYNLNVYPLPEGDFVGVISIEENSSNRSPLSIETIVIIDKSGSMVDDVDRIVTKILPQVFSKLSYNADKTVHIITFDSTAESHEKAVKDLKAFSLSCGGESMMAPAIQNCQKILKTIGSNTPIRILTISRGDINDVPETVEAAGRQLEFLEKHEFSVNSQAVRIVSKPTTEDSDLRAISSLLPANSTTTPKLIDVSTSESNSAIASKIAQLFLDDNLGQRRVLKASENIILKSPWEKSPASQILLKPGENIFWLSKDTIEGIKIGDIDVKVHPQLLTEEIQLKAQKKIESKRTVTDVENVIETVISDPIMTVSQSRQKSHMTAIRKMKRQNKSANRKLIRNIQRKMNYLRENCLWTEIGVEGGENKVRGKSQGKSKKIINRDDFNSIEGFIKHNYLWFVAAPIITYAACKFLRH
jgi:hypothetical protein